MVRRQAAISIALGLAATVAAAADIEVELKYRRYPDKPDGEGFYPNGFTGLQVSFQPPPGDWKLPPGLTKRAAFALAPLGDGKRLFVLDRKDEKDRAFTRLWFDANGNGDLTDDPAIDRSPPPEGADEDYRNRQSEFPPVDLKLKVDGKDQDYAFRAEAFRAGPDPPDPNAEAEQQAVIFYLASWCDYAGEANLGGRTCRLVFSDRNVNGRFDDRAAVKVEGEADPASSIRPQCDRLFLTGGEKLTFDDGSCLGDLLLVKDSLYAVRPDVPARKLTLTPAGSGTVTVELPAAVDRLCLSSEDGAHTLMAFDPGDRLRLPPGRYRLVDYMVRKKDDEGDLWLLTATGTRAGPVVPLGDRGRLLFGEPYTALAAVPEYFVQSIARSGDRAALSHVPLEFRLQGAGYESVDGLRRVSRGKTKIALSAERDYLPKEPSYKIMKTSGELVAEGSFQYG